MAFPAFGVLMLLTVVYLVKVHLFFEYLRDKEPEAWDNLGSPCLIPNKTTSNDPRDTIKFMRFLFKKEYLALADLGCKAKGCNSEIFNDGMLYRFRDCSFFICRSYPKLKHA